MAVAVDLVELQKNNVVAGTPVACAMQCYSQTDVLLFYGTSKQPAVYGTDYTVALAVDFMSFTFTPTASLITKITNLGEGNVTFVVRKPNATTDFTENDAYVRAKVAFEMDRVYMVAQYIKWLVNTVTYSGVLGVALTGLSTVSAASITAADTVLSAFGKLQAQFNLWNGRWISVKSVPFSAAGDGVTNDAPAFNAAVASLPATGGTIYVPSSVGYKLDTTVTDGGKPVRWVVGHAEIIGPPSGFAIELTANGSSFEGAGPRATRFKLTAPSAAPVMPTVTAVLTGNAVTGATINTPGSGLHTTVLTEVGNSPTQADAAIIATVAAGALSGAAVVVQGSGYAGAPAVSFMGGGAGAIKSNEVQHSKISGFSVDTNNIPNAVAVYQYGGWYAKFEDIHVEPATEHATAIGLLIDSHTLGVPGPNGSYGGVYVSDYDRIQAKKIVVIGHDTSTATTLVFRTLDCQNLYLHAAIAITLINPVLQGDAGSFIDAVNIDGLTLIGGDMEGAATWIKTHGSCNNVRIDRTLAYSATGPVKYGPYGPGWDLNPAKANSSDGPLLVGSLSADYRMQNTGWNVIHHMGIQHAGDTVGISANMKTASHTSAQLDDPTLAGFALFMNTSGQMFVKYANAGVNPVPTIEIAKFDALGIDAINLKIAGSPVATLAYVDALLAANDAMVFKGVIDCSANPNYPAADRGWTYRVSVAGKIGGAAGPNVENGDVLICMTDGTAAGTHAAVGAQWAIIQMNLDGAVIGPASAVDGTPIVADGATGKLIKNVTFAAFKTSLVLTQADITGLKITDSPEFVAVTLSADVKLVRDAANILAQRNGANPQALRVYGAFTDAANYERGVVEWGGGVLTIGALSAGSGVQRSVIINAGWQLYLRGGNTNGWQVTDGGHFIAENDNVKDIGAAGATRPRTIYVGTSVIAPTFQTPDMTVAALPAAAAGNKGQRRHVTDALGPAFLATVVGGGAVVTPVFSNGTNWVCG